MRMWLTRSWEQLDVPRVLRLVTTSELGPAVNPVSVWKTTASHWMFKAPSWDLGLWLWEDAGYRSQQELTHLSIRDSHLLGCSSSFGESVRLTRVAALWKASSCWICFYFRLITTNFRDFEFPEALCPQTTWCPISSLSLHHFLWD